ncbi:MAG: polyprenol monophosphomannose synthase [Chloroflexi bacterium]|nr:polyprenol monophosphomannose synthase [Chloroflexota bacterium]
MNAIIMLPTYNEKENIERLVGEIMLQGDVRLVIVDDSSPDGTGEMADRLASRNPNRIWVIHRQERGRGTAGIAGFRFVLEKGADCIIEMDADFSHDPRYIPQLLDKIKDYDVVIGSRLVKGGKSVRTPSRKVISSTANVLTRIVLGWSIRDWVGGYKCYRREALASLDFGAFHSTGYSIGMETLYRLKRKGFTFVEIPIEFTDKRTGASKFSAREITRYMLTVFRLRLQL